MAGEGGLACFFCMRPIDPKSLYEVAVLRKIGHTDAFPGEFHPVCLRRFGAGDPPYHRQADRDRDNADAFEIVEKWQWSWRRF